MPISKTFSCKKHGDFEALMMNSDDRARCPVAGCRIKLKELPSGPSLFSDHTKGCDRTLNGLATDFKMTDIKSTREGESQKGYLTRNNSPAPPREPRPGDAAIWGNKAGLDMKSVMAGGAFRSIRGESVGINPRDAGISHGPRPDPRATFRDPDNLKISK